MSGIPKAEPEEWINWAKHAPWELFGSDLLLEISDILTEPTCATAKIRFELPERAGLDIIAVESGDGIEDAVARVSAKAIEKLAELVPLRRAAREACERSKK